MYALWQVWNRAGTSRTYARNSCGHRSVCRARTKRSSAARRGCLCDRRRPLAGQRGADQAHGLSPEARRLPPQLNARRYTLKKRLRQPWELVAEAVRCSETLTTGQGHNCVSTLEEIGAPMKRYRSCACVGPMFTKPDSKMTVNIRHLDESSARRGTALHPCSARFGRSVRHGDRQALFLLHQRKHHERRPAIKPWVGATDSLIRTKP